MKNTIAVSMLSLVLIAGLVEAFPQSRPQATKECHVIHVGTPINTDDFMITKLPYEWTVTEVRCISKGSSSPVVTIVVSECDALGTTCESSFQTVVCTGGVWVNTTPTPRLIEANSSIRVEQTVTGTVWHSTTTICGTRNVGE